MYAAHFGLFEQPFNLTPDPDFVYVDQQHQAALETLVQALAQGDGFVKVTGEVGTGKTLLCRRLMAHLPASVVTACLFNPRLEPVGLLRELAVELGCSTPELDDEQALYRQIESALQDLAAHGHRVVCCIDEAHAMSPASLEALRLLSNIETDKRKLMQIVLFGQPELDRLLSQPELRSLRSRLGCGVRLEGMPLADFRRYLKHRMSVAGWHGPRVFSEGACWLLWRMSGGVPRQANALAHQCLVQACRRGAHRVWFKDALAVGLERWRLVGNLLRPNLAGVWQGDRT